MAGLGLSITNGKTGKATWPLLARGVTVWLVLMGAEFAHGIGRAIWLVPVVGDFPARQVGVFTGTIINFMIAALFVRWIHPRRIADALAVGITWLILTLTFEVAFGRLVMHASWQRIGSDYELARGGLLPIGLILLAVAPLLSAKVRRVF